MTIMKMRKSYLKQALRETALSIFFINKMKNEDWEGRGREWVG